MGVVLKHPARHHMVHLKAMNELYVVVLFKDLI